MADSDLDVHVSIRTTMAYLQEVSRHAKNAYVEAHHAGDLVKAERERRVYKYYQALNEAETNIQAAKQLADSGEIPAPSWDCAFKTFLLEFRLGPGDDGYTYM